VDNTTKNVSPNVVRAEEVGGTPTLGPDRWFEARHQALLVRLVRRQIVRQQSTAAHDEQNDSTDYSQWMPREFPPAAPPWGGL